MSLAIGNDATPPSAFAPCRRAVASDGSSVTRDELAVEASSASPHAVIRSEITWRSAAASKMPASATFGTLSAYASMSPPTTSSSAARRAIASMVSSRL